MAILTFQLREDEMGQGPAAGAGNMTNESTDPAAGTGTPAPEAVVWKSTGGRYDGVSSL